jgi:signal transduction histidine kinase
MIKLLFIIPVFFYVSSQAFSQTSLPPVYEIISDTAKVQILDKSFWQKLEDKEGKWTIEDVIKLPLSEKFHFQGEKTIDIDTNGIHTYWHRYRLRNRMDHDVKISLTNNNDYFDVFIVIKDSVTKQYHTGFFLDWEKRDGFKSASAETDDVSDNIGAISGAIPLVLKPGQEILVYDKRQRKHLADFSTSVRIWNTEKLIQERYVDYVDSRSNYFSKIHLQEAFLLGLLLLAIFLNVFFYRIVREKVYLYFALFAFFISINRLWNILWDTALWEHPQWLIFVPYLGYAWAFIPLFLIMFFREFLNTKQFFPKWDKFLFWLGMLNLILNVIIFCGQITLGFAKMNSVFYKFVFILSTPLPFFLIPLVIIITLLLYIRKKEKSLRYIMTGAFPLLFFYLFTGIWSLLHGMEIENFRPVEVFCICWLVLSFTLILMLRFDLLRKQNVQHALENERLAKEKEIEKNVLIEKQKEDLEIQVKERTADLVKSLEDLKLSQSQLIQSEKMASLGELTAGIAHEIQNPLNFVNNFSELSNELIDEMNSELDKGDIQEAKFIATDIKQNLEKINHHGKRADAIVKGMLQHSRSNSGQKEPTDINALCDEYLRLSYHGLRAKDKSFNATMKTDFDPSIGNINIIPQDIGRVILNLINNAFYAVNEHRDALYTSNDVNAYEPTVSISTKKIGDKVEIKVTDNGNGIPKNIVDKIFQPFFTTKPTGQGTGLGLSMSYDIITKRHGGELKVESKEGVGSTFIISLPL